jgi:hypothetical protein
MLLMDLAEQLQICMPSKPKMNNNMRKPVVTQLTAQPGYHKDAGPFGFLYHRQGLEERSRWIIPPHGTVSLLVQFSSATVGKWSEVLGFDVICGQHNEKVTVLGTCDHPHISTEAR